MIPTWRSIIGMATVLLMLGMANGSCPENMGGPDCSMPYTSCSATKGCYYDSVCQQREDDSYYSCDCSKSSRVVAGFDCEYPATAYCEVGTPISSTAFCTNEGNCLAYINPGEVFPGCTCPEQFTGTHCEYLKHLVDSSTVGLGGELRVPSTSTSSSSKSGITAGMIVFIVLLCTVLVGGMTLFMVRRHRRRDRRDNVALQNCEVVDDKDPDLDNDHHEINDDHCFMSNNHLDHDTTYNTMEADGGGTMKKNVQPHHRDVLTRRDTNGGNGDDFSLEEEDDGEII